MGGDVGARIRHVTAVLGPTNTGKTHLAIERMLGFESGMIGLPLRLLAREVYDKIGKRIGFDKVGLVTGEEKIKPENAVYWVCTVEAMPRDIDVAFLAIDEVQLAADPERGHIFTDRLLHARGKSETLVLGAQTMRDVIEDLIPGANFISRPRLSKLTYGGAKKITRLPTRSAIVAFSANEVYSLAELIRRQSGGAAVVLGALSPRTRNAQVGLYQSGEVDYLVATDAIGMGLNLDVNHVAFAGLRKFDGQNHRDLLPAELAQIAGRAGRHLNDGTFGVTGGVEPLDPELVGRLETHHFAPVQLLQWRNTALEFSSIAALKASLREAPGKQRLARARAANDVEVLELVSRESEIEKLASVRDGVEKLWEVCQVPDYRKISLAAHGELVSTLYKFLASSSGLIDEDWFLKQVAYSDKTDGDIDTLSNRIAHIRTWTFVSNRANWLRDPQHWQQRTREIEDQLSDALHERLTQRFVDRRTSALMKGMRDKDELSAEISEDGGVNVEGHFVGRLTGFKFAPDSRGEGVHSKAANLAAAQVLTGEIAMRVRRVVAAKADAFKLLTSGEITWRDMVIARIETSDDLLGPVVTVIADEDHVAAAEREKIRERLDAWLKELISERLKPLKDLAMSGDVSGLARGIAFQIVENFGILKREAVAKEITALDQPARAQLRRYGVRFGAFNIYIPVLLKPASIELCATLWAAKHAKTHGLRLDDLPQPPRAGLTSAKAELEIPEAYYRAFGYQTCGPRVVRLDMLERLADQIRPLLAWRKKEGDEEGPPKGSTGDGGFTATPEMMSILGCSPDELGHVLTALGFKSERRPIKTENDVEVAVQKTGEDGTGGAASASAAEPTDGVGKEPPATEPVDEPKPLEPAQAQGTDDSEAAARQGKTPQASAERGKESVADTVSFEEIWRPRRHGARDNRHSRGRDRNKSDRQAVSGRGAGETANAGDKSSGERAAKGRNNGRQAEGEPRGAGAGKRERGKGDREGFAKPSRRRGGPKGGRDRVERGHDRQSKSYQSSSPPRGPGKKKALDPDSPFAALASLRDKMTKRDPKPGASKDKS